MTSESEILVPLESNPDVMNKLLRKLGVPDKWEIVDVMGLDSETLLWVPRPVLAVILLLPESEVNEQHKKKEENEILSTGQVVSNEVFYMKQFVRNACGTIALLHSVANNLDKIELTEGHLKKFLDDAVSLDADARGTLLQKSEGIINAHKELAQEGQTNTPNVGAPVNHGFIAFIHKNGHIYELDGNKSFPINHGPTTEDSFLEDTAKVCKKFVERDPNDVNFTVVALAAAD